MMMMMMMMISVRLVHNAFSTLRTVPTFVTAHLEILRFPMGGAY